MGSIRVRAVLWTLVLGHGGLLVACGSDPDSPAAAANTTAATAGAGAAGASVSASQSSAAAGGAGGDGVDDEDGDGFTTQRGDCDDSDAAVNPTAVEVANGADDDCNGSVDDLPKPCDGALTLDDGDPMTAARAIDLCKVPTADGDWGVVSANWVMADGSPPPTDSMKLALFHLGHGMLGQFGPYLKPRAGARMLGLSSDAARAQGDPDFASYGKGYTGQPAPGYPAQSACGATTFGQHDQVAVELEIRVPSNAHGFRFESNYLSSNWPVLTKFVTFAAILQPAPAGTSEGQIAVDKDGYGIHSCTLLYDVCSCAMGPPCNSQGTPTVMYPCSQGDGALIGSGYKGATGWLYTTAPIQPASTITIRFAIGTTNEIFIGTTLIDNWTWATDPATAVATGHI